MPVTVRGKRYVFVEVPPERFFGFTGEPVQMATIERALLDTLHRPQRAASHVSWPAFLDLARRWQAASVIQRLGCLLDLHRSRSPPTFARNSSSSARAPMSSSHQPTKHTGEWSSCSPTRSAPSSTTA